MSQETKVILNRNNTNGGFIYLKEHPVYKGYYVTIDGRPFSVRELKPFKNRNGYFRITLPPTKDITKQRPRRRMLAIARMMWQTYNGKIPKGYEINHIDKDRGNNKLENLECVTRQENIAHRDSFPPF